MKHTIDTITEKMTAIEMELSILRKYTFFSVPGAPGQTRYDEICAEWDLLKKERDLLKRMAIVSADPRRTPITIG